MTGDDHIQTEGNVDTPNGAPRGFPQRYAVITLLVVAAIVAAIAVPLLVLLGGEDEEAPVTAEVVQPPPPPPAVPAVPTTTPIPEPEAVAISLPAGARQQLLSKDTSATLVSPAGDVTIIVDAGAVDGPTVLVYTG